jgi:hypothetical protein
MLGIETTCGCDLAMRSSLIGTGRARGKTILLGNNIVMYGTPAIAAPLPIVSVSAFGRLRGDKV